MGGKRVSQMCFLGINARTHAVIPPPPPVSHPYSLTHRHRRELNGEGSPESGSERRLQPPLLTQYRPPALTFLLTGQSWTLRGCWIPGGRHGRAHGVSAVTGGDLDAFIRGEHSGENLRLWWESVGEPSPGSAPARALSLSQRASNAQRCRLPRRMCLMTWQNNG